MSKKAKAAPALKTAPEDQLPDPPVAEQPPATTAPEATEQDTRATPGKKQAAECPPLEPDWLADEYYVGPLNCEQAARRLARHGHHVTKPAGGVVTK